MLQVQDARRRVEKVICGKWPHQVLDPATDSIRTVAGGNAAGLADGRGNAARLSEPAGLCAGPGGTIFVADTNNSAIRRASPPCRPGAILVSAAVGLHSSVLLSPHRRGSPDM